MQFIDRFGRVNVIFFDIFMSNGDKKKLQSERRGDIEKYNVHQSGSQILALHPDLNLMQNIKSSHKFCHHPFRERICAPIKLGALL